MNLPSDGSWNDPAGSPPWYPSHGTPTVSLNSIWMWSYNGRGEGVNLAYNFQANKRYCMETTMRLSTAGNGSIYPNGRINIVLSPNIINGLSGGYTVPTVLPPTQTIFNPLFSTVFPPNTSQTFFHNFIPTNNFGNTWFYPLNPDTTQIQMQLTAVNICLNEPCETLRVDFNYTNRCSSFWFIPYITGLGTNLEIKGYVWNFGDGTTSNQAFPNHVYATPGSYIVTLTIYTKDKNGKDCCKKEIKIKINVEQCDPCKLLNSALSVIRTN